VAAGRCTSAAQFIKRSSSWGLPRNSECAHNNVMFSMSENATVQKLFRSVEIWQSYCQNKFSRFYAVNYVRLFSMFVVERLFPFRYWWCYAWIRCSSWLRCNKHQFIADDAGIPRIYCELLFYSGRKKVTVWTLVIALLTGVRPDGRPLWSSIAHANGQLDPLFSKKTHHCPNQCKNLATPRPEPHSQSLEGNVNLCIML